MIYGRCKILKEWNDWDYSVHTHEKQIDRQGWAMNYPFTFDIDKSTNIAKFSSTSLLPYYITSLSSCNCQDFKERILPCKHIYRLAVELGFIEIIKRAAGGYDKEQLEEIRNLENVDGDPDQIKRQKSALKCKFLEIDHTTKTGVFVGSGKTPYETTLDSCTCRDFTVRKLPCKHIYRLRIELDRVL